MLSLSTSALFSELDIRSSPYVAKSNASFFGSSAFYYANAGVGAAGGAGAALAGSDFLGYSILAAGAGVLGLASGFLYFLRTDAITSLIFGPFPFDWALTYTNEVSYGLLSCY